MPFLCCHPEGHGGVIGGSVAGFVFFTCLLFGSVVLVVCLKVFVWKAILRRRNGTAHTQGMPVVPTVHCSPEAPPPYVPNVSPEPSAPPLYAVDSVNYLSSTYVEDMPTHYPSNEYASEYTTVGNSQEERQLLMEEEQ